MTPRYPLTWPDGWRRTNATSRVRAKFNRKERRGSNSWTTAAPLTIADAVRRVLDEYDYIERQRGGLPPFNGRAAG